MATANPDYHDSGDCDDNEDDERSSSKPPGRLTRSTNAHRSRMCRPYGARTQRSCKQAQSNHVRKNISPDECRRRGSSSKQNTPRSFRQPRGSPPVTRKLNTGFEEVHSNWTTTSWTLNDSYGKGITSEKKDGIFEAEINCVEEVNLHEDLKDCEKNPDHEFFIPPGEFSVNNLPPRYQDNDIVELVQALAKITVRISVKYTSLDRPDYYPNSGKPNPSAKLKGKTSLRTGSGWVSEVILDTRSKTSNEHCPCKKCQKSDNPQKHWAYIVIKTASHLVYDEKEGAETTCHFFYDNNDKHLSDLPSLHGAISVYTVVDEDTCLMKYLTHDISFANDLHDKWMLFKSLQKSVGEKYYDNIYDQVTGRFNHKLTIIVSHPHGCSKQISVGEYINREETIGYGAIPYTYKTPTCPGSSGGPVYVLSRLYSFGINSHWGQCEENAELNYSGITMF